MPRTTHRLGDTVTHLLALAARLEGEGQYNIAKLARAGAESLIRRSAYQRRMPREKDALVREIAVVVSTLSSLGMNDALTGALDRGKVAMAEGRLPLMQDTPHAYVCRTCGEVVLEAPPGKCPVCGARAGTFKAYLPVYWLDALGSDEALEMLKHNPGEVAMLIEGLSEEQLASIPSGEGWSIRNAIAHLRDAQGVLHSRLEQLLSQENPVIESLAVFDWAQRESDRPPTTQEIFDTYRDSRERTVAILENLPLVEWGRSGQHREFGTVTVQQQASYFAVHELTHFAQIESICDKVVG